MIAEDSDLEGGVFLSPRNIEFLEESLLKIEEAVEQIAQTLYKGNGHSLMSRLALLEQQSKDAAAELERMRGGVYDLKNRVVVGELKDTQADRRLERGDGKVWDTLKILIALALGAAASFIISGKLHS
jgi:hypothetical protein